MSGGSFRSNMTVVFCLSLMAAVFMYSAVVVDATTLVSSDDTPIRSGIGCSASRKARAYDRERSSASDARGCEHLIENQSSISTTDIKSIPFRGPISDIDMDPYEGDDNDDVVVDVAVQSEEIDDIQEHILQRIESFIKNIFDEHVCDAVVSCPPSSAITNAEDCQQSYALALREAEYPTSARMDASRTHKKCVNAVVDSHFEYHIKYSFENTNKTRNYLSPMFFEFTEK